MLTSADCRSPIISSEVHRYRLPDLCDFSKLKSKQELFILPVTEFLRHFCSYHQDCKSFVYWKSEKIVCLCLSWEEEKDSVVLETCVYSGITQLQLTVLLPYQLDSTINVRVKSSLLEDKAEESHNYHMPGAASCSVRWNCRVIWQRCKLYNLLNFNKKNINSYSILRIFSLIFNMSVIVISQSWRDVLLLGSICFYRGQELGSKQPCQAAHNHL